MAKSPGRMFAQCFADASESEEPEASHEDGEGDGSDAELPHSTSDVHPSIRRLQTYDAFSPVMEAGSPQAYSPIPCGDSQPNLARLKTFDPFNQPVELSSDMPMMYTTPAAASTAPADGSPGTAGTALPQASQQQPPSQQLEQQQQQQQGQPQQQWMAMPQAAGGVPAGGVMMTAAPGGAMGVQMMPMGMMQGMQGVMQQGVMQVAGGQVQPVPMQQTQGAPMQMMGMAMPAGMVPGMPAGAVMMVPGTYVGGPGGNFVQAPAMPQAAASAVPGAGMAAPSAGPGGVMLPGNLLAERAQPQTVTCAQEADGVFRVRWTVDARKLKGNDKTVVSPPFEIPSKATGTFKMMINPTPSELKGGATFRNSNGKGSLQLKCDTASESKLRIRFSIGDGHEEPPRGPLEHNFALNGVCGLPKEVAEWDFTRVVDEAAKVFTVCLELL